MHNNENRVPYACVPLLGKSIIRYHDCWCACVSSTLQPTIYRVPLTPLPMNRKITIENRSIRHLDSIPYLPLDVPQLQCTPMRCSIYSSYVRDLCVPVSYKLRRVCIHIPMAPDMEYPRTLRDWTPRD